MSGEPKAIRNARLAERDRKNHELNKAGNQIARIGNELNYVKDILRYIDEHLEENGSITIDKNSELHDKTQEVIKG
jgi:hypothetical protein